VKTTGCELRSARCAGRGLRSIRPASLETTVATSSLIARSKLDASARSTVSSIVSRLLLAVTRTLRTVRDHYAWLAQNPVRLGWRDAASSARGAAITSGSGRSNAYTSSAASAQPAMEIRDALATDDRPSAAPTRMAGFISMGRRSSRRPNPRRSALSRGRAARRV